MPDTTENPHQNVTFPSNGGQAHGYVALPPSGRGPGVVVIQEWWGLTSHITDVTDRLAADGFVALAPDLYGGTTTHEQAEAQELMQALPVDRAARDLAGSVDFLLDHQAVTGRAVGAIGFCMGGGFVLTLAAQQGERVAAAVPFYGLIPGDLPDFSGLRAAVSGHFGERDDVVPPDAARALGEKIEADTGSAPDFHFYPAAHAFFNDENLLGTYDADSARLAWDRALAFLHSHLG